MLTPLLGKILHVAPWFLISLVLVSERGICVYNHHPVKMYNFPITLENFLITF